MTSRIAPASVSSPSGAGVLCGNLVPSRFLQSFLIMSATGLLACLMASGSRGDTLTLENGNSMAKFNTTDVLDEPLGLAEWEVDGINHVSQQWFWYRIGDGPEKPLDSVEHLYSTALDVDDTDGNDILLAKYQDDAAGFMLELMYSLAGGTPGSNTSGLTEQVRVVNTNVGSDLDFHLFQYANFDVNGTPGNDAVILTGTPPNTARQTDPDLEISETVVTLEPSHWQAGSASELLDALNDDGATTLDGSTGPMFNLDAGWAFQWDAIIPPAGTLQIVKGKSLRTGPHIPEPSTFVLLAMGAVGLLAYTWRRRRR